MSSISELISMLTSQSEISNLLERDKFEIVSVKSFKAVGDGISNDTEFIRDCAEYATEKGLKSIYFPHGTYKVDVGLANTLSGFFLWGDNATIIGDNITINQVGTNITEYITVFTGLTDAPKSYVDQTGKVLKVKSTEDALEFGNVLGSEVINDSQEEGTTLSDAINTNKAKVAAHVAGSADKHSASHITNDSQESGTTTADAINANKTKVANHVAGSADKHSASHITYDDSGNTKVIGDDVGEALASVETELANIIAGDANAEVGSAHVSTVKGKTFVDIDARFEESEQDHVDLVGEVATKADVTYVDTQIQAVASGSPKGVYATLVALEAAYPTGTTGIYVVSADGHWYYWNGSAWADGGTYQATAVGASTVGKTQLTSTVKDGTDLMAVTNIIDQINTAPYGSTGGGTPPTCVFTKELVNGTGHYGWVTNSDYAGGGPNINLSSVKYPITTDVILRINYNNTVATQIQLSKYNDANQNVGTLYLGVPLGTGTYEYTITKGSATKLAISTLYLLNVALTGVMSIDFSHFYLIDVADASKIYNLKTNIEQLNIIGTNATSHIASSSAHNASKLVNDSSVTGSKVSDALNTLKTQGDTITASFEDIRAGTEIMAVTNIMNQINTTPYGTLGPGTAPTCVYTKELVDGTGHYGWVTNSDYTNGVGGPRITLSSVKYPITTDCILRINYNNTAATQIQMATYDAQGATIATLYSGTPAGAGTLEYALTKGAATQFAILLIYLADTNLTGAMTVDFSDFHLIDVADEDKFYNLKDNIDYLNSQEVGVAASIASNLNAIATINNQLLNVPYSRSDMENRKSIKDNGKIVCLGNYANAIVTAGTVSAESNIRLFNTQSIKATSNYAFKVPCNHTLKQNDVVSVFVFVTLDNINAMAGDGAGYVYAMKDASTSAAYRNYNKNVLKHGWNRIDMTYTGAPDVPLVAIRFVWSGTTDTPIYFDSVIVNRKHKPKILLNFDGSGGNLYSTIFPMMQARGFVGTGKDFLGLPEYQEILDAGWDYSMYSYDGRGTIDETNIANVGALETAILATIERVYPPKELSIPVAYFCPVNTLYYPMLLALRSAGFKMSRSTVIGVDGNSIEYFDEDNFMSTTFYIGSESCTTTKAAIDTAITNGHAGVSFFTHEVLTPYSGQWNTELTIFTEFLDYVKTKVDAGLVEVVTYKQFYESCVDTSRYVSKTDFDRLMARVARLESI